MQECELGSPEARTLMTALPTPLPSLPTSTIENPPTAERPSLSTPNATVVGPQPVPYRFGKQLLYLRDCLEWLKTAEHESVHAVVTDPPYGLREYEAAEQEKMRSG